MNSVLRKGTTDDINRVISYLGDDRLLAFYLYMDLLECGIEEEGLGLWISEKGDDIKAIMYQYYDCIHIFSRDNFPVEDALSVINEVSPKVIVSNEKNIEMLRTRLNDEEYIYELNHIITTDVLMKENPDIEIKDATKDDIPEISANGSCLKFIPDIADIFMKQRKIDEKTKQRYIEPKWKK